MRTTIPKASSLDRHISQLCTNLCIFFSCHTTGNGPPFTFFLAPDASEQIRQNFRLEMDYKGEGKAALYSKVPFDREVQKQYIVPVVIRDSGYPSLSSTASLLVNVGDLNDNTMKDSGYKDATVYCITQGDSYARMQRFVRMHLCVGDCWDARDAIGCAVADFLTLHCLIYYFAFYIILIFPFLCIQSIIWAKTIIWQLWLLCQETEIVGFKSIPLCWASVAKL